MVHLQVPLTLERKGAIGDGIPNVLQSTTSTLSSSVMLVCTFPQFLDKWKSIISNSFVLNMVKGHNLQLISHPPLFCN